MSGMKWLRENKSMICVGLQLTCKNNWMLLHGRLVVQFNAAKHQMRGKYDDLRSIKINHPRKF